MKLRGIALAVLITPALTTLFVAEIGALSDRGYGDAISARTYSLANQLHLPVAAAAPPGIRIIPGGGPVHVEANDQDGNRLDPRLFSWAVPAGADIGVQPDASGWLLTAPVTAASGAYVIPVQFLPSPLLSPSVTVVLGKAITKIQIVTSPP